MNNTVFEKIKEIHPYNIWIGTDQRWKTYIQDSSRPKGRKLIVKSNEELLYQALYDYYEVNKKEEITKIITIELLYPEWLEYKKLHTTASTYITRLNSDWNSYYANTSIIKKPINQINKLTLDIWAHSLIKDNHMNRKKYTNVQTIMRQVLTYAVDLGLINFNPMDSLKIDKRIFEKCRKKPDRTQVFSNEEKKNIIKLAWNDYYAKTKVYELSPLALIFQFHTGLRIGELCCVKYEDVEGDYIHIQRMIRRDTKEVVPHTKTDCGDRYILLTNEAKRIIETTKNRQTELSVATNNYIFSINDLPITERCIIDLLKKYTKALGILYRSSHKVRKTYGSNLLDAGISINTTRAMLGHSDEKTTLKYYCYDTKEEIENKKLFEQALQ